MTSTSYTSVGARRLSLLQPFRVREKEGEPGEGEKEAEGAKKAIKLDASNPYSHYFLLVGRDPAGAERKLYFKTDSPATVQVVLQRVSSVHVPTDDGSDRIESEGGCWMVWRFIQFDSGNTIKDGR